MKRLVLVLVLPLALFGKVTAVAVADDTNPPPWRGQPRTTYGQWDFATDVPDPAPVAGSYNPYGPPRMWIDGFPSSPPTPPRAWKDLWEGRAGVWHLSGDIWLDIPNAPDQPQWHKELWVQLTWIPDDDPQVPPFAEVLQEQGPPIRGQLIEQDPIGPGAWMHSTWLITLPNNPREERLHVSGSVLVDQLVVDTRCAVPEPSTFVLLSVGVTGLLGFAWRRRKRTA